jgi:O-antigen/teichoic acid export membrane protein
LDKASEIGKVSAAGSFMLFAGTSLSNIILAVGTVVLARVISPEQYGLYSIALIPSQTFSLFQDWGMNAALIKYVAYYRGTNEEHSIHDVIITGLAFKIVVGAGLSLLSLLLAGFLATAYLGRPDAGNLVSIASIVILAQSLLSASQAMFVGFERMGYNSLTMLCQAVIKSVLSPLLVLLSYGALGALLGHTFSLLFTGGLGLIILYTLTRGLKKIKDRHSSMLVTLKKLLRFGIPLSISSILAGFFTQFFAFEMALYCNDATVGNYRVAVNFTVLLTFFTVPVSTVLFPAFAKIDPIKERRTLQTVFGSSVKYAAVLLVPATLVVMTLSSQMVSTLFGDKWISAPFLLTLQAIGYLFVIFGDLNMTSLMSALGETTMLMLLSLLTLIAGIPLAFLMIPTLGITGVILGILLAAIPRLFCETYYLWKKYEVKVDYVTMAKILVASLLAAAITYLLMQALQTLAWAELIVGTGTFAAIYVFTICVFGALDKADTNNLRTMFSGLGVASKIINILLRSIERLIDYIHKP